MKFTGILIGLLALVIAIVPMFTDCQSQGKAIQLANGKTVPMKCHWTGVASLALAGPLLMVGAVTTTRRQKETHRVLGLLGVVLGAFVILIPTTLIGVCGSDDMLCNAVMRPTLVLSGALVVVLSAVALFSPRRASSS